jgi:hypothetical protein
MMAFLRQGYFTLAMTGILVIMGIEEVRAEPYFAARTGFKCSQCHVNKTGGGKRTDYGVIYSQYKLLMASAMKNTQAYSFDPKLSNSVSVGANFRIEPTLTQAYTTKPIDTAEAVVTEPENFVSAKVKEANFYLQVDLVKDFLTFYYDKSSNSGSWREMWGMAEFFQNTLYLKAGFMLLPYGMRMMDDEAFIRNATGYTYGTSALSYEVGWEPGPVSLVVNANDNLISSVGYVVFKDLPMALRSFRLGGQYSLPVKTVARRNNRGMGVFGMATMGMFSILAERDLTQKDSVNSIEDYVEIDFLPMQGLNFKGVIEWMTPDTRAKEHNGRRRITLGAEPFVTQFLQLGLYYRINDFVPQAGVENQDQVVGRVHVFF